MAKSTTPLSERIESLRTDIEAFIDARVAAEAKECPGVPASVLRQMATARAGGCQCAQYLQLTKEKDAA